LLLRMPLQRGATGWLHASDQSSLDISLSKPTIRLKCLKVELAWGAAFLV
jgi:hypothetical protein